MRLTVVGCSGSIPGPDSPASCYLVQAGETTIVLDLGSGALGPLQRYVPLDGVDAVLLSHLHPDHCMDLCGYYVALRYGPVQGRVRVPVWGPAGVAQRMAEAYGLPADPGMSGEFDFRTYPGDAFEVGGVRVRAVPVPHPVAAYAVRLEWAGRTLVFSGDAGPTPALPELAEGADVFLCEASFLSTDDNPPDLHLTGRQAGEYASAAGVGRLVVTHVPPWGTAERAAAEARSAFPGPVVLARSGLVVEL